LTYPLAFDGFADVALVEAKMMRFVGRGLGPLDGNAVERFGDQLLIRHIRAGDRDAHLCRGRKGDASHFKGPLSSEGQRGRSSISRSGHTSSS
jgi:hypothetical protein